MNEQFKHAFWLLSRHTIARYLLSNTIGREDGYEKAERHRELCQMFVALKYSVTPEESWEYDRQRISRRYDSLKLSKSTICLAGEAPIDFVHDHTQELTGHLEKIGMPMDKTYPDYDVLAKKFNERFLELANDACEFWLKATEI